MLVLSRRQNESIRINEEIVVEVLEIRGNRVRLGIRAPEQVRVVRAELSIQNVSIQNSAQVDGSFPNGRDRQVPREIDAPAAAHGRPLRLVRDSLTPGRHGPDAGVQKAPKDTRTGNGATTIREPQIAYTRLRLALCDSA